MVNYVINLNRRRDRWEVVKEHLNEQGLFVTRFPAIDNGWKGCRDSHLSIMEKAIRGVPFAIYEDDVLFVEDMSYLSEAYSQLPPDWDCLYLGASPKQPQDRFSENLFRLYNAHTTHAIIWRRRDGGAIDFILSHRKEINKIDDYFALVIQGLFNCFVVFPLLATQTQTKSDTCTRSDTSTIVKNYYLYCK